MRGYVLTPPAVVDLMVAKLFEARTPSEKMRLLDPGCGNGALLDGVVRWCRRRGYVLPQTVGVELHPGRSEEARRRFDGIGSIRILTRDFLQGDLAPFDFVVGNPPYVAIDGLGEGEKVRYRAEFETAVGRFDLYVLFWEKALRLLKPGGRLVFITPEKFMTVESARPLRRLLSRLSVPEVQFLPEDTFVGLTTYPTVTTVDRVDPDAPTRLLLRDGSTRAVRFTVEGGSLAADMYAEGPLAAGDILLGDVCTRVSCGVATGADRHFVRKTDSLDRELHAYAYPTVSGRQLVPGNEALEPVDSMLVPYDRWGRLLAFERLNGFGTYLEERRESLLARTCTDRKPWYAFHETPPLEALLRPKILCKDVAEEPYFWVDRQGEIVPRHSVYYIVPRDEAVVYDLAAYLNGPEAGAWLMAHCQRVRKGFIRLQSTVLKRLPVPSDLATASPCPLFASALT